MRSCKSLTNADSANMAFLATEERYRWMRSFEARNLVVPVVGDFAGPKAIRSVGDYLEQRGATVTAFYTSNVEQYLFTSGVEEQFYRNLGALPIDSTSRFIRSLPGGGGGPPVVLSQVPIPPSNTVSTSAFVSGIASIVGALEAFADGRLRTYGQVMALTKTNDWGQPSR